MKTIMKVGYYLLIAIGCILMALGIVRFIFLLWTLADPSKIDQTNDILFVARLIFTFAPILFGATICLTCERIVAPRVKILHSEFQDENYRGVLRLLVILSCCTAFALVLIGPSFILRM
jgi:hypothetical protein